MPGVHPTAQKAIAPKAMTSKAIAPKAMVRAMVSPVPATNVITVLSLMSVNGGPWQEFGLDRITFTNPAGNQMLRLKATQPANGIAVTWDPESDPDVIGYNVYYGTASRAYTNVASSTVSTASIKNLTGGTTYYLAVTAYDAAGLESDYSAEITYTVPPGPALSVMRQVASGIGEFWKDYPPSFDFATLPVNAKFQMSISNTPL